MKFLVKFILFLIFIPGVAQAQPTPVFSPPVSSIQAVYLSWGDFTGAVQYEIYWDNNPGVSVASPNMIAILNPGELGYMHTNLTGGITYYYVIRAIDNLGNWTLVSPEVSATPIGGNPSNFAHYGGGNGDGFDHSTSCFLKLDGNSSSPASADITVYASVDQNLIVWPKNTSATDYTVFVSTDGITFSQLTTTTAIEYTHTVPTLSTSTTYFYQVRANVSGCPMNPSAAVAAVAMPQNDIYKGGNGDGFDHLTSCVVKLDGSSAAPPSDDITVYSSVDQNFIVWPQNPIAIDYSVFYSTNGVTFNLLNTTTAIEYTHIVPNLTTSTQYFYQVRANVSGCPMNPSTAVSAIAMPQNDVYKGGNGDGFDHFTSCVSKLDGRSAAPASGSITVYSSVDQNFIVWPQNSTAIDYTVFYSTNGVTFNLLTTTTAIEYTHIVPNLTTSTTYFYQVRANVSGCPMNPSAAVTAVAMPQNDVYKGGNGDGFDHFTSCIVKLDGNSAAPASGNITVYSSVDQNFIVWPQNPTAIDYTVFYSTNGVTFTVLSTTSAIEYTHIVPNLTTGTNYFYQVQANVSGCPMNPSLPFVAVAMPQNDIYKGGNGDGFDHLTSCVIKLDGRSAAPPSGSITVYSSVDQNFIVWPQHPSATNYTISSSTNGVTFTVLSTTNAIEYTHIVPNLTTGTNYFYQVQANVSGCPMSPSSPISAIAMPQNDIYKGGDGDGFDHVQTCSLIKLDQNTVRASGPLSNCTGDSIVLMASLSYQYQWNLNGNPIPGATGQNYTATQSGNYTVSTFNIYSCSMASVSTIVQISTPPTAPSFSVSNGGISCDSVILTLHPQSTPGVQYFWQGTNALGQSTALNATIPYTAYLTGRYYLTAFDSVCWSNVPSSDTVFILGNPTQITPISNIDFCIKDINNWKYILAPDGKVIAAIQSNGQNLGNIYGEVFVESHGAGITNQFDGQHEYLNRHFVIQPSIQPTSPVLLRLYFTQQELQSLIDASLLSTSSFDDVISIAQLMVQMYEGPTEDGVYDMSDATFATYINQNASGVEFGENYVEIVVNSFSEFWILGTNVPLPVELAKFDVKCEPNNRVRVEWQTHSEQNNAHFIIEKSKDLITFEQVAIVTGQGNSNEMTAYELSIAGNDHSSTSYYRISQVDFDGTKEILSIQSVNCTPQKTIELFPNPASNTIHIVFYDADIHLENASLRLVDMNGRVVTSKNNLQILGNSVNATLSVEEIAGGLYLLELYNNEDLLHLFKVVVVR